MGTCTQDAEGRVSFENPVFLGHARPGSTESPDRIQLAQMNPQKRTRKGSWVGPCKQSAALGFKRSQPDYAQVSIGPPPFQSTGLFPWLFFI